ncbi:dTDP-4-dehydrorhamnose reductase [Parashewanella tropica]|uniref:dTDP-4-dehydrorhamnose reductase n=1 Tax=Parashewanella tropica TaxID=2547970 RepID=UPI00105A25EC|nr:dTDP-4-dehydrorhamnose reductase [Parashewanella tropica]
MKLMICGANGQVGRHLVEACIQETNINVLALSRNDLNITERNDVFEQTESFRPNIIINAAAYTQVDKAEEEPELAYCINAQAVEYLSEVANAVDAILIHISTDYVFDGKSSQPYQELSQQNPLNIYGTTKWQGEQILLEKARKPILIRTSWVFCESDNNFVATMLRLSKSRKRLSIVDDQMGAPTYAKHLAEAIINIAEVSFLAPKFHFGIYHFCGQPFVSWFEFAKVIFEKSEQLDLIHQLPEVVPIASEDYSSAARRPKNSCLQTSRFFTEKSSLSRDWQAGLDSVLSPKEKISNEGY